MWWNRGKALRNRGVTTPAARRPRCLRFEPLEGRLVPSTFTVTTLTDGGPGSLRQAVLDANAHLGADTVAFKSGLEGTIFLAPGPGEIAITGPLTVLGPGAAKIAVDGNAASRIFVVDDLTPAEIAVTLKGLQLRNGNSGSGGAVFSREDLTLTKTVISNNRSGSVGGGVFASGHLTITRSTISDNVANEGGGIYFAGFQQILQDPDLRVDQSTISGNISRSGSGGGGLYLDSGTALLRNSVISGNAAEAGGGGILTNSSLTSLDIENTRISDNRAGGDGGGLSTFTATTITNSVIASNRAGGSGGGLDVALRATTVTRSVISGNSASVGGGVRAFGPLALTDSTVSGNSAGVGGGLTLLQAGNSSITGSTLSGNTGTSKGGAVYVNYTDLLVRNSTLSGNQTTGQGGAICTHNAGLTVENSTIAFNRAFSDGGAPANGGGISSYGYAVTLASTIISGNSDDSGHPDLESSTTAFSAAFSLIGSTAGVGGAATFTQTGPNLFGVDPRLAPLASNGGPTQTHRLKAGSPAINKGSNPTALAFDQRGKPFKRQLGSAVDIGAVERQ